MDYRGLPKSLTEAKQLGSTWYFTGRPCKHGHIDKRLTVNSTCVQCAKVIGDKYRSTKEGQREVAKARANKWYHENKERRREYNRKNIDRRRAYKEKNKHKDLEYRVRNKEVISAKKKLKRKELNAKFVERYRKDPILRLMVRCRKFVRRSIEAANSKKSKPTKQILWYTVEQFKQRIECQFKDGMNWENQGEWHIDHKVPISRFIEKGVTDPAVINCLANLQPLWARDNLAKGNRRLG